MKSKPSTLSELFRALAWIAGALCLIPAAQGSAQLFGGDDTADRKSTRLNSSH